MKKQYWSLMLVLALTACSTAAPTQNDVNEAVSSSTDNTQIEASSVAPAQSSARPTPVTLEQALDREFSSQKLGIAFRYPSTAFFWDCGDPIPVTAREKEYSVEFVLDHPFDPSCAEFPNNVYSVIYAQRVLNKADLRQFIDRVFSPNCEISEESEYEENGSEFTRVFLQSKNRPKHEPDFECSESVAWNRTAGVAMFSPLGSKNGGGIDWPSQAEILMPDGSTETAFDYLIMQSVRYLK